MKLWGGRFTKETNELVNNFNASISFDQKFYKQDIQGSIAHATMLAAQGIISEDEGKQITDGLKGILSDIESGKLEITDEYDSNLAAICHNGTFVGTQKDSVVSFKSIP